MARRRFVTVAVYVNAICLVLIMLYVSIVSPTFNINFYERQFVRNNTHAWIRIEPDDLTVVTQHLIDYMRGREDELQITTYISGEEVDFFTERAIDHMVDVRNLFDGGRVIFIVCIILFVVTLVVVVFNKTLSSISKAYLYTACAATGLFAIIALIAVVSFDFAFEWFHHIFFFNDLWLLNYYDRLLNIVPTEFFINISIYIGLLFVCFMAMMIVGGEVLRRYFKRTGGTTTGEGS